jgi:hypothetical protein
MPAGVPTAPAKQLFDAINQQLAQINAWIRSVATQPGSWIAPTLENGWVNFGGEWTPAGYIKDALGFVHIQGTIKSGTSGKAAFVLPAGYRPGGLMAAPRDDAGPTLGAVEISPAGQVVVFSSSTSLCSLLIPPFLAEN